MKRWNQKGSVHAKRRMAELREKNEQIEKSIAITEWANATGRPAREWWDAAQAAGLTRETTQRERINWLRTEAKRVAYRARPEYLANERQYAESCGAQQYARVWFEHVLQDEQRGPSKAGV